MNKKIIFSFASLTFLVISLFAGCSYKNNGPELNNPDNTSTPSGNEAMISKPAASPSSRLSPTTIPTASLAPTVTPQAIVSSAAITDTPGQTTGITSNKRVYELLNHMTLEEKVGQMFFVRCRNETALADIQSYHFGGYILFDNDFIGQTKGSMVNLTKSYQKAATMPMLIGVDEEGGSVIRISKFPSFRSVPFKSPQDLYKKGGLTLIKSDTKEKAQLLKSLGINVNLAPVCDVSTNPSDFIYKRSFGKNAFQTAAYVKTVVEQMNLQGIGCTLKHFPGYGNNVDTHTGIAIDKRSYKSFEESDFIPFQAGINAGSVSVLVSHNIVEAMDKKYPASLSAQVHTILRKKLNFNGVIMTDDLSMNAIKEYTSKEEAAVLAIIAGNDMVITSDFDIQIPAVLAAVKNGKITIDRIDKSIRRILTWKLSLGLIK